jgi:imidazolonepropionase-like amidohydrolase
MRPARHRGLASVLGAALLLTGCERGVGSETGPAGAPALAFVGARLIDGTGAAPIENGVLLVRDGRIAAVGPAAAVEVPADAERIDVTGRTIIPGIVNAHGHVGGTRGLESGPQHYTRENVLDQLGLYARYGVTTVVSLGDDGEEGVRVRDEQDAPTLDRARLFVAGPVLDPPSPEAAAAEVERIRALGADWVKIRVDDGLGQRAAMPAPVYRAVIEEAHRRELPLAAHMVYLADAKSLVRAGADLLAHSVRDAPVDAELIGLMRERGICLSPTLTRELSTFVYGSRPAFFDDPFFLREADPAVVRQLEDPERQRRTRESEAARYWERALPLAKANAKALLESGVRLAFGTDSGPPGRFQGFFEHLEMEMMADAGLTPMQVLVSATGDAARCTGLDEQIGTLAPGRWADLVVLERDPLEDIRNARSIESVWIRGNRVPGAGR